MKKRRAASLPFLLLVALSTFLVAMPYQCAGAHSMPSRVSGLPANLIVPVGFTKPAQLFHATTVKGDRPAWVSSNPSVATIDPDGMFTAIAPGTTTLTAANLLYADKIAIDVTVALPQPATGARMIPRTIVAIRPGVAIGKGVAITPHLASFQPVAWASSNPAVATVDSTGRIVGVAVGTATITATTTDGTNLSVTATVIVTTAPPATRVSAPQRLELGVGSTLHPLSEVIPSNAVQILSWSSSNTSVATVDADGRITGVAPGNAVITGTTIDNTSRSASINVTVSPRTQTLPVAPSVILAPGTVVGLGRSRWLTADVVPGDVDNRVRWSSSNPAVARVERVSGRVHGIAFGTATITATAVTGGRTATMVINVVPPSLAPVAVAGVAVQPTSLTVRSGSTGRIVATVTPRSAVDQSVTWTSSNPAVATVDSAGVIRGVAPGRATIAVITRDGRRTATTQVIVNR